MSKRHVFPSLRHPEKHAYTLHEDSMALWDQCYRADFPLWSRAGLFDTCGDGTAQHGGERCVSKVLFEDYCASLASYLHDSLPTLTEEEREALAYMWFVGPSTREINFLLSVKYQAGKKAYYSLQERKISKGDSKQYDKRWEEVPTWADGTTDSAIQLLYRSQRNRELLEMYAKYDRVRQHVIDHEEDYGKTATEYLEIPGSDVNQAFAALARTFEALRSISSAKRVLDCHKRNVLPRRAETPAETPAEEERAAA